MSVRKDKNAGGGEAGGMGGEIEMLRGLLRRALALASALEESDPQGEKDLLRLLRVLDSLSRSAARTGRMLVTQRQVEGDGLLAEALSEATERAVRKLSELEGGEHGPG